MRNIFFMSTIQAFFSLAFIFFISYLAINIASFIFFYYRESKSPFCLHYVKSSLTNESYSKNAMYEIKIYNKKVKYIFRLKWSTIYTSD
jgi:hypothetical protein